MTLVKVNNPLTKSFNGLMGDFFNELPANFGKNFRDDFFGFPPVNISENGNAYQLEVAVPGIEKADFNVKLENNLLTISSEKKAAQQSETDKVIRKEFSTKAFKRSFTLDEKIDAEAIDAKYENGVLKVNLPKKEVAKAAAKEINVQ